MSQSQYQRPPFDPDFTHYFAIDYVRQNEILQNEDYLRIGDFEGHSPATNITIHDITNNHVEDVPRTGGGIVTAGGFAEKEVTLQMTFANVDEIFGLGAYALNESSLATSNRITTDGRFLTSPQIDHRSLACLIAQFKRTPILPVENQKLRSADIDAVALKSLQIATILNDDGTPVPNCIQLTLIMCAFAWGAYCPGTADPHSAIIMPLLRWNWRQEWAARLPGEYAIYVRSGEVPSYPSLTSSEIQTTTSASPGTNAYFPRYPIKGMNGDYQFLKISQTWLDQLDGLRQRYNELQAYMLSDEFRTQSSTQDKQTVVMTLQSLLNAITELTGETHLKLEPVDLGPDLILTHIAASIENGFVMNRIASHEYPAYQHMGQGDVRLTVTFHATSEEPIARLQAFIADCRRIARDQRYEMVAGFVGFQNEVASLLGVSNVVFTDLQVTSIEGLPGNYLISIEMCAFDRRQRHIEALQSARNVPFAFTRESGDMIEQKAMSSSTELGYSGSSTDPRTIFWERYIADRNQSGGTGANEGMPTSVGFDSRGRPNNAWYACANIQEAKEQMASLELYPDLKLPTWERLFYALDHNEIFTASESKIRDVIKSLMTMRWTSWSDEGRFVDPDFYIDYPNNKLASYINTQGLDMGSPTAYFTAFSIALQQLKDNPTDALHVNGSLGSSVYAALTDDFPVAAFFGPPPPNPDGSAAGPDANYGKGHDNVHALIQCPHPNSSSSSLIAPTFMPEGHPGQVVVDGKTFDCQHPNEIPGTTSYGTPDSYKKLTADGSKGYIDKADESSNEIFGEGGQDSQAELNAALTAHHPVDAGVTITDEHGRLLTTFMDLLEHDHTGRLIQAYPSYVVQLIDEGPRMGWTKLMPNFFALQSIQSIDVIQDRRDPIHTCTIQLINAYGNISNYTQGALSRDTIAALFNHAGDTDVIINDLLSADATNIKDLASHAAHDITLWLQGLVSPLYTLFPLPATVDTVAQLRRKQNSTVMLVPGTRIHVRMGYGANGAKLPILFNGTITDVGHSEHSQIVAMGDGFELQQLIPTADTESKGGNPGTNTINRPQNSGLQNIGQIQANGQGLLEAFGSLFMATGYEPRELICNLLNSQGQEMYDYRLSTQFWNHVKRFSYTSSNGIVASDNPLGIVHFGNPYLFDFWHYLSGKSLESIDPDLVPKGRQELHAYDRAKKLVTPRPIGLFPSMYTNSYSKAHNNAPNLPITDFLQKVVGAGLYMIDHQIPTGYGETGENVYGIYSPFNKTMQNVGSLFHKEGYEEFKANSANYADTFVPVAGTLQGQAGLLSLALGLQKTLEKEQNQSPPPDMNAGTPEQIAGPLVHGGLYFNMYTANKTAWDVISFMAQAFPPYIAAVRPFEYRSTLYWGAPWWQYRYDYNRISAYDLGQTQNNVEDQLYGYPYSYKVKPFIQAHYYDSAMNLLDNTIRASDEDTYTDVIAMWYTGQGFQAERPQPIPQHQTVDRSIMSGLRKTAIVNTDYVGLDVAPSKSAIIGGLGLPLLGYWAAHYGGIPGTNFTLAGGGNHFIAEKGFRQTARAILRDYQRLMYQGEILVIGDPTAKPYDLIYINDQYTDIRGMASIRRVVHHFGFDVGYTTTIEPDLLCEVKGENYLTSLWTWVGGYIASSVAVLLGSKIALMLGRRKFNRSLWTFGLKLVNKQSVPQKLGSPAVRAGKAVLSGFGFKVDNKPLGIWQPRPLLGNLRGVILDGLAKILGKRPDMIGLTQELIQTLESTRHLFGAKSLDESAQDFLQNRVEELLSNALDRYGSKSIDIGIKEAVSHNLLAGSLEKVATKSAAEFISSQMVGGYIDYAKNLLGAKELLASGPESVKSFSKIIAAVKEAAKGGDKSGRKIVTAAIADAFPEILKLSMLLKNNLVGLAVQFVAGALWTGVSRWWDDATALQIMPLQYRGAEFTAGINGHQEGLIIRGYNPETDQAKHISLSGAQLEALRKAGVYDVDPDWKKFIAAMNTPVGDGGASLSTGGSTASQASLGNASGPIPGLPSSAVSSAERIAVAKFHGATGSHYTDIITPYSAPPGGIGVGVGTRDSLISLLQAFMMSNRQLTFSAITVDHGVEESVQGHLLTSSGHNNGCAVDIVAVNGRAIGSGPLLPPEFMQVINQAARSSQISQIGIGNNYSPPFGVVYSFSTPALGNAYFFSDHPDHIHLGVHPS